MKSKADGDDNNDSFAFDGMEDVPFFNNFKRDNYNDSRTAARDLFSMMVRPVDIETFFRYGYGDICVTAMWSCTMLGLLNDMKTLCLMKCSNDWQLTYFGHKIDHTFPRVF